MIGSVARSDPAQVRGGMTHIITRFKHHYLQVPREWRGWSDRGVLRVRAVKKRKWWSFWLM